MLKTLEGKRIVLAGSRKLEELSAMIEKRGGIPIVRSLQGLMTLAESDIEAELRVFTEQGADWSIFTTGTGLEALLGQTDRLGLREAFLQKVEQSKVGVRGYKTYGLLKNLHIQTHAVDEDGTTKGLIDALASHDFSGKRVFVQLHGEPVPELVDFLEKKHAIVQQLLPYRHVPPAEEVVLQVCREIEEGAVDAICFTTGVQVRYLFDFAKQSGRSETIRASFNSKIAAVAVGRVTAEALKAEGITNILTPESERMGAMVVELGAFFSGQE
ncbi:uroporphyrinogen-III synthase [Paenibacillus turpanensis]|uniref:uroporphyrinogen-III synthase n=1 Tax=Paenibacillus turpanensis TaxID=2689078 RepID=UPI00140B32B0|nr:uroporphyrinogen-III synthase [Paenibacillus turpanensis]